MYIHAYVHVHVHVCVVTKCPCKYANVHTCVPWVQMHYKNKKVILLVGSVCTQQNQREKRRCGQ